LTTRQSRRLFYEAANEPGIKPPSKPSDDAYALMVGWFICVIREIIGWFSIIEIAEYGPVTI